MASKDSHQVAMLFWEQKMGTMSVDHDPLLDKKVAKWKRTLSVRQTNWLIETARSENRVAKDGECDRTDGEFNPGRGFTYNWDCKVHPDKTSVLTVSIVLPDAK